MKKFLHKNNNMKRIILIFLGLFSLAYAQYSPTGAKTRFINGISIGTKLDSYFNAADSNAIYWRSDSVVMAKYRGTARALSFIDDTAFLTNRFVRLQTGNLYRQTGKMWVSDTIYTSGILRADSHLRTDSIRSSVSTGFSGQINVPNNTGYASRSNVLVPGLLLDIVNITALDTLELGNSALPSVVYSGKPVMFTSSTGGYRTVMPNASGTIALTSNVTDSAAALRASINTKLNISDTAAMLANNIVRTFGAQTVGGVKTFTNGINADATSVFTVSSGNAIQANASSSAASILGQNSSTGTGVSGTATSNSALTGVNNSSSTATLAIQNTSSGNLATFSNNSTTGVTIGNTGKITTLDSIVGVNQRLTGTLNGTTVSMTGGYTSTTTGSSVLTATTATTSQKAIRIANTSGDGSFGVESSGGNSIFLGASPYTTVIGSIANRSFHLAANNTVGATLDSIGRFGIGTKTPSATLDVVGTSELNGATTVKAGNGNQIILDNAGERFTQENYYNNGVQKAEQFWDNTNNYLQLSSSNSGSTVRIVAQTNGVELANGATSFSAISDERMKVIKRPIENATSKLNSYRSVIGRYKSDSTDVERAFLIAQDVQKNYPYAISVSKDSMNTLRLSYTELIPLLIKGFQEQSAKVSELEARVAKLEELIKLIKP